MLINILIFKYYLIAEKTRPQIIGEESAPQLSLQHRPRVPERKLMEPENPRLVSFLQR